MSDFQNNDPLIIGGVELQSRLFIGTGKYSNDALIPDVCASSGAQVITVAMRRVEKGQQGIVGHIPSHMRLLPNTSGARTAEEAVRLARLARAAGCGDWIKIEVISDTRHLLPDGYETAKATEILAKEGFTVLPYINPDLYVARAMIGILIEEIDLPIVVDAGIGLPSHACEAMEMGAAACLVNTGIASSTDPVLMGRAFRQAVEAGRAAWLAGPGAVRACGEGAQASSPLTGFLR